MEFHLQLLLEVSAATVFRPTSPHATHIVVASVRLVNDWRMIGVREFPLADDVGNTRSSLWGDPLTFWAPPTCRRSNRASVLVSLWELRVSRREYRAVMLETASSLSEELQQRLFKECNCWRKAPVAKLEEASWRCESGGGGGVLSTGR